MQMVRVLAIFSICGLAVSQGQGQRQPGQGETLPELALGEVCRKGSVSEGTFVDHARACVDGSACQQQENGNTDEWTCQTHAPINLGEVCASGLIREGTMLNLHKFCVDGTVCVISGDQVDGGRTFTCQAPPVLIAGDVCRRRHAPEGGLGDLSAYCSAATTCQPPRSGTGDWRCREASSTGRGSSLL